MTPEQFVFWMKGFIESANSDDVSLSARTSISRELDKVFLDKSTGFFTFSSLDSMNLSGNYVIKYC